MNMTGRKENMLRTMRSMGSRRSGRESNRPMYRASRRRFIFIDAPSHHLDERVLEGRRLEGHPTPLVESTLDDRDDVLVRLRGQDLPRPAVRRERFDDHAHAVAAHGLRLVHAAEEDHTALV